MSIEQSFQSSLAMRDRPVIAEELIVRQDIPDPISVDSELPRATALVKKLKGYTVENWNNLGDDVVVRGLDALTHGILASWAALDEPYALGWVARSLEKQIGYVPSTFRDLYSYTAIKQIEESPSEEWGRYEVRTSQSFEHRRALTALLIWPELAAKIGVDFWSELMDPLAQLQMNIGNNPAQVSVESRVAGMSIPRETRELVGRIRFAQMARAMGDAIYAFQTYALQAVAQRSYYQGALANDLGTAQALALVWDNIKTLDKPTLQKVDSILGLGFSDPQEAAKLAVVPYMELPAGIQNLLDEREQARKSKDFARADELRKEIESQGFVLKDTSEGPKITRE
ncbi:MAG: Cysteine-tRNA ligase [Microgenomates group bacterium GW2011_GWC1_41_8]|nr:MAG: Cysteine-tRNA ligase [Microgenomates group bacterium GW2011_GWC1_41_8]